MKEIAINTLKHVIVEYIAYTGHKPGMRCAHSKIARVVFVLYVVGRAY